LWITSTFPDPRLRSLSAIRAPTATLTSAERSDQVANGKDPV
jgi:hypothetical protein